MLGTSYSKDYDWVCHDSFALRVCEDSLIGLYHDLHARMHPVQAPQHPFDGLILGIFDKNTLDRNDILGCVPLSMELVIADGVFHLPFGCITMDWQDWDMTCM